MASSRQTADPPRPPLFSIPLSLPGWLTFRLDWRQAEGRKSKKGFSPKKGQREFFLPSEGMTRSTPSEIKMVGSCPVIHMAVGAGRKRLFFCDVGKNHSVWPMALSSLSSKKTTRRCRNLEAIFFFSFPTNLSRLECCTKTKLTLILNLKCFILTVPYYIHYIIFHPGLQLSSTYIFNYQKKIKILYRSPENIHTDSKLGYTVQPQSLEA